MTDVKGSEVLTLSRQLRPPAFDEQEVQELFLQLGEKFALYEGGTGEKLHTLLATYQNDGRIDLVMDAVDIIKPGLLPPRTETVVVEIDQMDQQTPNDSNLTIEWHNRFIMVAQWDARLPFYIARLFAEPTVYQEFLAQVRSGVLATLDRAAGGRQSR